MKRVGSIRASLCCTLAPLTLLCFSSAGLAATEIDQIWFGNLHSHTSYSDGSGTPEQAYKQACSLGLDFFAITEHNHAAGDGKGDRKDGLMIATSPMLYRGKPKSLVETADRLNQPGHCVTIYGQEFSTISQGNHANVFDVGAVINVENGRFDQLLGWLDANRDEAGKLAIIQFNHPRSESRALKDYGRDDFGGDEIGWVQGMAPHVSLIEVLNAPALRDGTGQRTDPHQAEYFRYLNLGFKLAPSVGQDNHYPNWGSSTDARVAVLAPELTRMGILTALRARHAYATEDKNLRLVFRSGASLQGDVAPIPTLGTELPLTLEIRDADEPNAQYRIDVFKDLPGGKAAASPVESYEFKGNTTTPLVLDGVRFEAAGEYVLIKVTQFGNEDDEHAEDDRSWTAPIWFESAVPVNAPPATLLRIVQLVPDPAGDDNQNESVTLKNNGATTLSLLDWKLRDLAENLWSLDPLGTLAPGEEKTIKRGGAAMSLNNGGDRIELVGPDGSIAQVVDYDKVGIDEVVTPQ